MALDFDVAVMLRGLHEEQRQRPTEGETTIDAETLSDRMVF